MVKKRKIKTKAIKYERVNRESRLSNKEKKNYKSNTGIKQIQTKLMMNTHNNSKK